MIATETMLIPRRPSRRLALSLCLAFFFLICLYRVVSINHTNRLAAGIGLGTFVSPLSISPVRLPDDDVSREQGSESASQQEYIEETTDTIGDEHPQSQTDHDLQHVSQLSHRVLFSTSTKNREFMRVYLGGVHANNINIIPHPTKAEFWILVAQPNLDYSPVAAKQKFDLSEQGINSSSMGDWPAPSEQVSCTAGIQDDNVICAKSATRVPFLGPQLNGVCLDDIAFLTLVRGWRDSRVFMGPELPYMMYGAKSASICFGQWLQDARAVLPEFEAHRQIAKDKWPFTSAVEVTRSSGAGRMEKNYFLFWDAEGNAHVHYTLWPERSFSRLQDDRVASQDLALSSEYHDKICMAKFMPSIKKQGQSMEDLHQATNSLAITMCKRSDQLCQPNDSNTFIVHLFQRKTYGQFHAVYEPYVILFQRHAPFAIHAIGQRPYWIHGRQNFTDATESDLFKNENVPRPKGHTEMFYITSMNWKSHMQRYHGYIDDVLFISFGIEDTRPGIIDILAGDLFDDLAYC